jgi:hypothetical protein
VTCEVLQPAGGRSALAARAAISTGRESAIPPVCCRLPALLLVRRAGVEMFFSSEGRWADGVLVGPRHEDNAFWAVEKSREDNVFATHSAYLKFV